MFPLYLFILLYIFAVKAQSVKSQLIAFLLLGLCHIGLDGSLIFSPFTKLHPSIHSAVYRCRARTKSGTILSRPVTVRAGKFLSPSSHLTL